jgi:hypothetical protein
VLFEFESLSNKIIMLKQQQRKKQRVTRGLGSTTAIGSNNTMEELPSSPGSKRKSRTNSIMAKLTRGRGAGKRETTEGVLIAANTLQSVKMKTLSYVSGVNAKATELLALVRNEGLELQERLNDLENRLYSKSALNIYQRSNEFGQFMQRDGEIQMKQEATTTERLQARNANKEIENLMGGIVPIDLTNVDVALSNHAAIDRQSIALSPGGGKEDEAQGTGFNFDNMFGGTGGNNVSVSSIVATTDGIGILETPFKKISFYVDQREEVGK